MNYKKAYLYTFNQLSDVIELLESMDNKTETLNLLPILKSVQVEAERMCIDGKEVQAATESPICKTCRFFLLYYIR